MRVCEHCLNAIKSHGEKVWTKVIYVDESDPEESKCEFCEDEGFDTLWDIRFR